MSDLAKLWADVAQEEKQEKQAEKLEYLRLEGTVRIRVLDATPHAYQQWWASKGNGGAGCSIPYKGEADLLEKANKEFLSKIFEEADARGLEGKARKDFLRDEGYKKQPYGKLRQKYAIHVLDRADGKVKLLDKGPQIFKELKALVLNPEYGDLRQYDISITTTGKEWHEKEYSVTPARSNTPLTSEEIQLYEEKRIDIAKIKSGGDLTPEQCLFIANGGKWDQLKSDTPTATPPPPTPAPSRELTPEELANLNF